MKQFLPRLRHVKHASLILGVFVAAVFFFAAGAVVRLLVGPVSLGPFAGVIEDALNSEVKGLSIRFDSAVLEWSRSENRINLIVLGTKMFDATGRIVAQAPRADLDLDAVEAFKGHVAVKRIALLNMQLTAQRTDDGVIHLGLGDGSVQEDLIDVIRRSLGENSTTGTHFKSFAIQNARLAFRDDPLGMFVVSPDADFTVEKRDAKAGGGLLATLAADIELSGSPARVNASAVMNDEGTPTKGALKIAGFKLSSLAANSPKLAGFRPLNLSVDMTGDFTLNPDRKLVSVDFGMEGGGEVGVKPTDAVSVPIDHFQMQGAYDAKAGRVTLKQLEITGEHSTAKANGDIVIVSDDDMWSALKFSFDAEGVGFNAPDLFPAPNALSSASFRAQYNRATRTLEWERIALKGSTLNLDASGTITLQENDASPAISMRATLAALDVRALLSFWPKNVGEGARAWIADNLSAGRIGPVAISASIPAGALDAAALPENALSMRFPLAGATVQYMKGLTLLTGVDGEGLLTGDTFHATIAKGNAGPLQLVGGEITVPNLHDSSVGNIQAHVEGGVADIMTLLDMQPLGYAKRFHLDPKTLTGHAGVDLDFVVPMEKNLDVSKLKVGVTAKMTGLGLPLGASRHIDGGNVSMSVDGKELTAQGTASVEKVPVTFKWTEVFTAPKDGITTAISLSGRLDGAGYRNLGLGEPDWFDGSIPIVMTLSGSRFLFKSGTAKLDLTPARMHVNLMNYTKAQGAAASAAADLVFAESGAFDIKNLAVTGPGLNVHGGLSFDEHNVVVGGTLPQVRAGNDNDFSVVITSVAQSTGGGRTVRIEGRSYDAGHLFAGGAVPPAAAGSEAQEKVPDPFTLDAKLARVALRGNLSLQNFNLFADISSGQRFEHFTLDAMGPVAGTVPTTNRVNGQLEEKNGVRTLTLSGDAAGSLIAGFTGFDSVRGGKIAVTVHFPADTPSQAQGIPPDYRGVLKITGVTLVNQPFFTRLFSAGSLDGPLRLLQGSGIPITEFETSFAARGKFITISDGRAEGSVGFTVDGTANRRTDQIDIQGTLVPVYTLNSFLGNVPIVGDILVSKPGEGLIGLTYTVKGDIDEPQVAVNPLSVLTPGIFRRIFQRDIPTTEEKPATQTPAPTAPAPAANQAPASKLK